jgi:hypothetical protein
MNAGTVAVIIGAVAPLVAALIIVLTQNQKLAKQTALSSVLATIEWMEQRRGDRHVLYNVRDQKKPYESWSDEERAAADRICRWFDILGVLDSLKFVDRKLVDRFYAIPAFELWDICKPHVQSQQKSRGAHHLWEFAQLAESVRCVKQNHPAIAKSPRWPRNPRKC